MLACVDVGYQGNMGPAVASCVVFKDWELSQSQEEHTVAMPQVAPYVPGQLYRRELPCILLVLGRVQAPLDVIVVDGHVWLDERGTPGLGAHLHAALDRRTPVIGVAKNPFGEFGGERRVLRGTSRRPLFVTAVGIDVDVAAQHVRRMHGAHRIPSMLSRADQLCRTSLKASPSKSPRRTGQGGGEVS